MTGPVPPPALPRGFPPSRRHLDTRLRS